MVLRHDRQARPRDDAEAPRCAGGGDRVINPSFFPSRRLALYMVRLFVTRSLAVLIALVLILMTLDLLGESGKILAVPGNTDADIWRYASLRLPILFAFNELIVVNSTRTVTAWTDNDYKPVPPASSMVSNVWVMNGDDLVHAGVAGGRPFTVNSIEIFDRS